jgi:putative membrane protein
MSRVRGLLFAGGVLLFIGILITHGVPVILATLSEAGWGLLLVAAFHLLPLWLDALAIDVLLTGGPSSKLRDTVLARWAGESANSLLPAGQIGGPVLMARHLMFRGLLMSEAAAAITVSTTLQTVAQILFALLGVMLLGARASHLDETTVRESALIACFVLGCVVAGFYALQRRGLYAKLVRASARFRRSGGSSGWMTRAESIDQAVQGLYGRPGVVAASFGLSLVGWLAGTGEVFLILLLVGHPVSWLDALLIESLGQGIRGAAFAVPGAVGVQEGGYLLLAPLVGLTPDIALGLSLAKRARELMLGVPGLLYLHASAGEGARARRGKF